MHAARATSGVDLRRRLIEVDAVCIAVSWAAAMWLGVPREGTVSGPLVVGAEIVLLVGVGLGLIALLHLYRSRVSSHRSVALERLALVAVALAGIVWATERIGVTHPSVRTPLIGGVLTFVSLAMTRSWFEARVTLLRRNGELSRDVVLVGPDVELTELQELLLGHPEMGYRAVGYLSDAPSAAPELADLLWLGPIARCAEGVLAIGATGALIAANGISSVELNAVVRDLHRIGAHVQVSSGLYLIGHRRVRQLPLAHEPFFYLEAPTLHRAELVAKRTLDVIGASVVLVLTAPLTLLSAALIRIFDGSPVLFRQVRIGQHGEEIVIRKLRTMTNGAEEATDSLRALNARTGPLFKIDDDPRVTRLGRWLRVTSIDELPQLLNVLDGSLSLVGPRPALPEEVAEFDDELLERQLIRPGVTGLWQAEARHNRSFYAYRHLDLFYLENWRLSLDLAILLATARSLVSDVMAAFSRVRDRHRQQHVSAGPTATVDPSPEVVSPPPRPLQPVTASHARGRVGASP